MNSILWESDRRDEEPTRFEPIKEEDESDDETPVKKEGACCEEGEWGSLRWVCLPIAWSPRVSFDPVESDRRDDEVSAKKETPKPSFGLPADCMMSTG